MSVIKKIVIGILSLVLLLLAANYGVTWWLSKKLPGVIQEQKDFPYNISYRDMDIDLLGGNFTITEAAIAPKDSLQKVSQEGVFGQIKKISVQGAGWLSFIRNNKMDVDRIIIEEPEIILYDRKKKYTVEEDVVKPFKNSITTEAIVLKKGRFVLMDSLQKPKAKAVNIDIEFTNIKVDSTTLDNNVPVKYATYNLKCDSIFYQAGSMYHLEAANLSTTDSTLTIQDFKLVPELSKIQFAQTIPKEKDQFRITAKKIDLPKLDWGYFRDTLFVHTPQVTLNNVHAVIYRPKMAPDDFTTKKLYSQMLRELDFDLKVDKLLLKNSYLEYQEQMEYGREPAKVSFSNFNATIANLYSPVNKKEIPTTVMDVNCRFMKQASMQVRWTFNIPDVSDSFTIKGHLKNIKSANIDPVSKPLMNVTTDGDLNDVIFTLNGNRNTGSGNFAINYENLTVELYKKDGEKKNKLMTAVGNLLVKNDSGDELKKTYVTVDRVKYKSAFNFLWRFLQEGLKKTLLPKILSKEDEKK